MPMDNIRIAGVIDHVDRDPAPLPKPEDRARNLAVVARGPYCFAWCQFERDRGNAQRVVRFFGWRIVGSTSEVWYCAQSGSHRGVFEQ